MPASNTDLHLVQALRSGLLNTCALLRNSHLVMQLNSVKGKLESHFNVRASRRREFARWPCSTRTTKSAASCAETQGHNGRPERKEIAFLQGLSPDAVAIGPLFIATFPPNWAVTFWLGKEVVLRPLESESFFSQGGWGQCHFSFSLSCNLVNVWTGRPSPRCHSAQTIRAPPLVHSSCSLLLIIPAEFHTENCYRE